LTILNELAAKGATFKVYDPIVMEEAKWRLENIADQITYCENEYETMDGCDAVVILTEWNQFRNLDLAKVKELLKAPHFFDFRNVYKRERMEKIGFHYVAVEQ
jgi:UDPglucose 6-dehydrogenase